MGYLDGSGHINKIVRLQRENDIITMLLEGRDRKEIKLYLMNKYKISKKSSEIYIADAANIIKERRNYDFNVIISLHIARYEYIYTKFHELGAWFWAQKALKAKEVLMGFHKQGFHMRVTQGQIQEISQVHSSTEYDLQKIQGEKRDRMNFLLDKARTAKSKELQDGSDRNKEIDGESD